MNDRLTAFELSVYRETGRLPERFGPEQARALRLALPVKVVKLQGKPSAGGPRVLTEGKYRSKTEAAYAIHLEGRRIAGEVKEYGYERVRLVLADRCTYTPDFDLWMPDGTIELHEVKGFWRDDARVKFKIAVRQFPQFRFRAVTKVKGDWVFEG